MFTGIALVRERERGNMEMLIATPVSPWELTVGKVLPFVGIGLLQVTVVLLLGKWVFGVPVRGSLLDVYAAALIFIVASLALGILISTLAKSQFQAMQMTFFVFLPQILLSGFIFPFAGMPKAAQWLAEILPMTHFVRLIRAIMVRGAGMFELSNDILALVAIAAVLLTLSTRRINKRLD
jgi:ABC-2 type transport system permease protein